MANRIERHNGGSLRRNGSMVQWKASSYATLIGSMPHRDRGKVIDLILREISEIPVWPQLPLFQPEQMMTQYLEGLPGVRMVDGRLFVQTDGPEFEQELYAFYEEYLEIEANTRELTHSRFKMGPETGRTFFQFLEAASGIPQRFQAVKGQIVGPFTLLAGLKDHRERALLYDDRMQDVVVKQLSMKARWQIERLEAFGCPVILFLDEPALAGFGSSAFISVSREMIQQLLGEVIDTVHDAGALAGIHICANTDWLLAFHSAVDIINFDAYNHFEKFALYRDEFMQFIKDGRTVAWGMVPTEDPAVILKETAQNLADLFLEGTKELTTPEIPLQRILSQSLFTPSCGCGCLPENVAERVVVLSRDLSRIMRSHL
jgi:hypothetical protein